jgi:hypothetical protein
VIDLLKICQVETPRKYGAPQRDFDALGKAMYKAWFEHEGNRHHFTQAEIHDLILWMRTKIKDEL